MKEKADNISYATAYEELQQIVAALQQEQIGLDELPEKIARAGELVQFCREHLRKTEAAVEGMTGDGRG